eukprot:TRINITY_DN741_c0_g1_i1.p1 TRINITY_DN741_c0_g1~~TRINITY_DN741_c0_g1_i1.p1  ORF type:complete len:2398 (-),score=493.58 TRINITY_DN741_c0_g1_i1:165-7358(-)
MARRATQCAVAMLTELDGWESDEGDPLSLHVSIGVGSFIGMHIGGYSGRWDFTIHGDPLDQIGICEKFSTKRECMISKECYELIQNQVQVEEAVHDDFANEWGVQRVLGIMDPLDIENPWDGLIPYQAESALRRYVNPLVMGFGDAGQNALDSEFRTMSVMFIKLQGVTTEDPEKMVDQVHAALRVMQKVILELEGTMLQFRVDEKGILLIAAYGLPGHAHEDDAFRAGMTARQITRELKQTLNLGCGIGITTGRAYCGSYGAPHRRDYSMMGNIVNTSARLMSRAENCIICDELTVQRSGDRLKFEVKEQNVKLKGIEEPVVLYSLTGVKKEVSNQRTGPRVPLVGRTSELMILKEQLSLLEAGDAKGSTLIIEGEPGMGKSQLAAELQNLAKDKRIKYFISFADPVDRNQYMVFKKLILEILEVNPYDPPIIRVNQILEMVQYDLDLHLTAPLLNDLFTDLKMVDTRTTELLHDREKRQETVHQLLLVLIERALQFAPKVIVLEDASYFDESSWKLLHHVAQLSNVLLVLTTRPMTEADIHYEYYNQLVKSESTLMMKLTSMTAKDTRSIIAQRLGVKELPKNVERLILQKSAGNPSWAEEIGLALRDQGVIVIENGRCVLATETLDEVRVPPNLGAVILSRIDRLNPTLELCLKICAVIGERVLYKLLHDIYPIKKDQAQLPMYLNEICSLDLLVQVSSNPRVYQFKHGIAKSVVYDTLLYGARRKYNRAVASWYEANYPMERREEVCTILASHWHLGEVPKKALFYREMAGEQAYNRWAHEDCIKHFTEAVAIERIIQNKINFGKYTGPGGPGQLQTVQRSSSNLFATNSQRDVAMPVGRGEILFPPESPTSPKAPSRGPPGSSNNSRANTPTRPAPIAEMHAVPEDGSPVPSSNIINVTVTAAPAGSTAGSPGGTPTRGRSRRPSIMVPSQGPSPFGGKSSQIGTPRSRRGSIAHTRRVNPLAEAANTEEQEEQLEPVTAFRKAHWHTMMSRSHFYLGQYLQAFSEASLALALHGIPLPSESKWVLVPKTIKAMVKQVYRRFFDVSTVEKRRKDRLRAQMRAQMFQLSVDSEDMDTLNIISSAYENYHLPNPDEPLSKDALQSKVKLFRLQELLWLYDIVGRVSHSCNDRWLWEYTHLQELNVAEELQDLPGSTRGLGNVSLGAVILNHTSIAHTYLDHAERSAEFMSGDAQHLAPLKAQLLDSSAYATMQVGRAFMERCNFEKAAAYFTRALEQADDIKQSSLTEAIRFNFGLCNLAVGEFADAHRLFTQAHSSANTRGAEMNNFQAVLGEVTAMVFSSDPEMRKSKEFTVELKELTNKVKDFLHRVTSEKDLAASGKVGDVLSSNVRKRSCLANLGVAPSEMMWAYGLLALVDHLFNRDDEANNWAISLTEFAEHIKTPLQSFAIHGVSMCLSVLFYMHRCDLLSEPHHLARHRVKMIQTLMHSSQLLSKSFPIARVVYERTHGWVAYFIHHKLRLANQRLGKALEASQCYRLRYEEALTHSIWADVLDATEDKIYRPRTNTSGAITTPGIPRPLAQARMMSTNQLPLHRINTLNNLRSQPSASDLQFNVDLDDELEQAKFPGRSHRKKAEFIYNALGGLEFPAREIKSREQLHADLVMLSDSDSDSLDSAEELDDVVNENLFSSNYNSGRRSSFPETMTRENSFSSSAIGESPDANTSRSGTGTPTGTVGGSATGRASANRQIRRTSSGQSRGPPSGVPRAISRENLTTTNAFGTSSVRTLTSVAEGEENNPVLSRSTPATISPQTVRPQSANKEKSTGRPAGSESPQSLRQSGRVKSAQAVGDVDTPSTASIGPLTAIKSQAAQALRAARESAGQLLQLPETPSDNRRQLSKSLTMQDIISPAGSMVDLDQVANKVARHKGSHGHTSASGSGSTATGGSTGPSAASSKGQARAIRPMSSAAKHETMFKSSPALEGRPVRPSIARGTHSTMSAGGPRERRESVDSASSESPPPMDSTESLPEPVPALRPRAVNTNLSNVSLAVNPGTPSSNAGSPPSLPGSATQEVPGKGKGKARAHPAAAAARNGTAAGAAAGTTTTTTTTTTATAAAARNGTAAAAPSPAATNGKGGPVPRTSTATSAANSTAPAKTTMSNTTAPAPPVISTASTARAQSIAKGKGPATSTRQYRRLNRESSDPPPLPHQAPASSKGSALRAGPPPLAKRNGSAAVNSATTTTTTTTTASTVGATKTGSTDAAASGNGAVAPARVQRSRAATTGSNGQSAAAAATAQVAVGKGSGTPAAGHPSQRQAVLPARPAKPTAAFSARNEGTGNNASNGHSHDIDPPSSSYTSADSMMQRSPQLRQLNPASKSSGANGHRSAANDTTPPVPRAVARVKPPPVQRQSSTAAIRTASGDVQHLEITPEMYAGYR